MYCQACGSWNPDEQEHCSKCHQKLLVVSGGVGPEETSFEEEEPEEEFSFDEHLLERISILEEAMKRTADSLRQLLAAVNAQERSLLVQQASSSRIAAMPA